MSGLQSGVTHNLGDGGIIDAFSRVRERKRAKLARQARGESSSERDLSQFRNPPQRAARDPPALLMPKDVAYVLAPFNRGARLRSKPSGHPPALRLSLHHVRLRAPTRLATPINAAAWRIELHALTHHPIHLAHTPSPCCTLYPAGVMPTEAQLLPILAQVRASTAPRTLGSKQAPGLASKCAQKPSLPLN